MTHQELIYQIGEARFSAIRRLENGSPLIDAHKWLLSEIEAILSGHYIYDNDERNQ